MFRSFSSKSSSTASVDETKYIIKNKPYLKPDHIKVVEPKPLTAEEEATYQKLFEYLSDPQYVIRSHEELQKDEQLLPLYEEEKLWLSKDCLIRYLRACKWGLEATIKRLELSIAWRREFGLIKAHQAEDVVHVTPDSIKHENETGKSIVMGFDKHGRPIIYLKNGRQNTKPSQDQIRNLIYFIEGTIAVSPRHQGFATLVIDFKNYDVPGTTAKVPNLAVARQVLHILQTHYPERLGMGCFVNTPYLAHALLKMLMPFMDPVTKSKIVIDEGRLLEVIDLEELDKDYGGLIKFDHDHEQYWEDLANLIDDVKEQQYKTFKELDGIIGLNEADLKPI